MSVSIGIKCPFLGHLRFSFFMDLGEGIGYFYPPRTAPDLRVNI